MNKDKITLENKINLLNSRRKLYISLAISTVLYLLLSFSVHLDMFRTFDYELMVTMQKKTNPAVDYIFSIVTLLGSSEFILAVISFIFCIFLIKAKKYYLGIFLYLMIYPLEILGKLLIFHPKPPVMFHRYVFNFRFPSSIFINTNFSFPSGHMARCTFLAVLLTFLIQKLRIKNNLKYIISLLIWTYPFIMFVSRIYLGEHWFSDVLGGLLLGLIAGIISLFFL